MRFTSITAALLVAAAATLLGGCGSDATAGADQSETGSLAGSITVSAAASLTEAFTAIGEDFMAANPGAQVQFTFDSSSTLAQQVIDGAPVDVFASADEATMAKLTDPGLISGESTVFATNQLVIVTKPGNPAGITGLADLPDVGIVSLCGEEVPCGRFAKQILDGQGVSIAETDVTRGQNVKAALAAVAEGDAVAGIVYVSDAQAAAESVTTVDIPAAQNAVATYPIGVVAATGEPDLAQGFVDYVSAAEAQQRLAEYGFGPPE